MRKRLHLGRDPFARQTVVKVRAATELTCDWCGQRDGRGRVYHVGINSDARHGTRIVQVCGRDGIWCSMGCARAYHGE